VGEDGFRLLDLLSEAEAPADLAALPMVETLRRVWARHYERQNGQVRWRTSEELAEEAPDIESPYDTEARYRKRRSVNWVGYLVHVSESCDEELPRLITHVDTTLATVHEAQRTEAIQQLLVEKGLPPAQHLVDAAYVDAELLVSSQTEQGIALLGPTRQNASWQAKTEGAYDRSQFTVDWDNEVVSCPQGKRSVAWHERTDRKGTYIHALFHRDDCRPCPARALCTRSQEGARRITLQPRPQFEALQATRCWQDSQAGKQLYNQRAGVEGTISQAVRRFGLRQARYRGLLKTHLQHLATVAAINIDRLIAWLDGVPRAQTRTSRFAALAPAL
jgi:transposase